MKGIKVIRTLIIEQNKKIFDLQSDIHNLGGEVDKKEGENKSLQDTIEQTKKDLEAERLRAEARVKANVRVAGVQTKVSAPAPATGDVEQYRSLVAQYDWNVDQALLVMGKESGGNKTAVSSTDDHGLMQIHNGLANYGQAIYDPATNIKVAYGIWKGRGHGRGWTAWYSVCPLGGGNPFGMCGA